MLNDYYEKYDPAKGYERLLFRSGKGLQSRELNDLQSQFQHQVKGIADVLLKDGDLVADGEVVVDRETGLARLNAAAIYLRGQIRTLAPAEFTIALDGDVAIGVWLQETVVTETEDPLLRDPAVDAFNYDEPGAARLKVTCRWGLAAESQPDDAEFYPVHRIDNGVPVVKQPPPQLDSVSRALARYDREANGGSYVVDGMKVTCRGEESGQFVFSIEEGKAHIQGFELAFHTSRRETFAVDPDEQRVKDEPHRFEPDQDGAMRVDLAFSPVFDITEVNATVETRKILTHGTYAGVKDPLPDDAVLEIVSVSQNGTEYVYGSDFLFSQNQLDWSPSGQEPAPGSTYEVVYRYREQLAVEADEDGFTLNQTLPSGDTLVSGSLVTVDYGWHMPRVDLLVLDQEGRVQRIKGLPNAYRPFAPKAPDNMLVLAQVEHDWRSQALPAVTNLAVRSVPMSTLEQMQQQIEDLFALVAVERLKNDANAQDPSAKFGVFVDPFIDDDMRDAGIEQSAAIIDGELLLPVTVEVAEFEQGAQPVTLPYSLETVLEQSMQTGQMKVNPYQAFEPIPARVVLRPSVDHWTKTARVWSSPITRRITQGSGLRSHIHENTRIELLARRTRQVEYLRQRTVRFEISGFGPGEVLSEVLFDGIKVTPGG